MTISANWDHHHFFIQIPILYLATFWSILSKKTHVLVVTVELIWLLPLIILSFNFAQTQNKSLRFIKCRKSYVHRSTVVQTNHCQICGCLCPTIMHLCNLFLLSTPVTQMLSTPRCVNRRKDVK